jgi:hypothetical protein
MEAKTEIAKQTLLEAAQGAKECELMLKAMALTETAEEAEALLIATTDRLKQNIREYDEKLLEAIGGGRSDDASN